MCNPWEKTTFLNKMKNVSDGLCDYCLPDCKITIYETAVSSAPFQPCDHTNLQSASMCKMSGNEFNPPPWLSDIKHQYHGMIKININLIVSSFQFQLRNFFAIVHTKKISFNSEKNMQLQRNVTFSE